MIRLGNRLLLSAKETNQLALLLERPVEIATVEDFQFTLRRLKLQYSGGSPEELLIGGVIDQFEERLAQLGEL